MRLSLCNEVLAHLSFEDQCRTAKSLGYDGLEIAPFTLASDPSLLSEKEAEKTRAIAADHGLVISSLHWLMVKPEGLSISTEDQIRWRASTDFLHRMIAFAAHCGASVLVHGSPKQRSPEGNQTLESATAQSIKAWSLLGAWAAEFGVTYCIEPLSRNETPVVNTLADASAVVERIQNPRLRTMLDLSACAQTEIESAASLASQYLASGHIAHIQVNDKNRRGPGQGDTPVAPLFNALRQANFDGWIAVEPFIYEPDALGCATFCANYCNELLKKDKP